jgi:hypothetical protein
MFGLRGSAAATKAAQIRRKSEDSFMGAGGSEGRMEGWVEGRWRTDD